MNTWQNNVSLNDFYQKDIPSNYCLKRALYTTMSIDDVRWPSLLALQHGIQGNGTYSEQDLFEELKRTDFVMQKGKQAAGVGSLSLPLEEHLVRKTYLYPMENGFFFHAKLIILRYCRDEKPDYYRIAVTSQNLTRDSDDQNFLWCDGYVGFTEVTPTANGLRLWAYVNDLRRAKTEEPEYDINGIKKKDVIVSFDPTPFENIKNVQLNDGINIYFSGVKDGLAQGYKNLHDMIFNGQMNVLAVTKSEFVGDYYRTAAEKKMCGNISFEVWNRWDGSDNGKDHTHMKVYHTCDNAGQCTYWMGSANCSENALKGNNVECLVRVPTEQSINNIQVILCSKGYRRQESFTTRKDEGDESISTLLQMLCNSFDPIWESIGTKMKVVPQNEHWIKQRGDDCYYSSEDKYRDYGVKVYPYGSNNILTDKPSLAKFVACKDGKEIGEMRIVPAGADFSESQAWQDKLVLRENYLTCAMEKDTPTEALEYIEKTIHSLLRYEKICAEPREKITDALDTLRMLQDIYVSIQKQKKEMAANGQ